MATISRGRLPWLLLIVLVSATAAFCTIVLLVPGLRATVLGVLQPVSSFETSSSPQTIYNPGKAALDGSPHKFHDRPDFLYKFYERADIESLDPKADKLWHDAMTPPLGGFLLVAHNETFYRGWGVSMFHALHCLGMLRSSFQTYFGLAEQGHGHDGHNHGPRNAIPDLSKVDERQHVEHCMGYIAKVCPSFWTHDTLPGADHDRLYCAMAMTH
jgi:hypothetical protein